MAIYNRGGASRLESDHDKNCLIGRIAEECRSNGFLMDGVNGTIRFPKILAKDKGKLEKCLGELNKIAKNVICRAEGYGNKYDIHYVPSIKRVYQCLYCFKLESDGLVKK